MLPQQQMYKTNPNDGREQDMKTPFSIEK